MGPVILLDKSAFESFNDNDIQLIHFYYFVNTAPTLLTEIIGDLAKKRKDGRDADRAVAQLAAKLFGPYRMTCADHRSMLSGALQGHDVPLTAKIPIHNVKSIVDEDGQRGMLIDSTAECETYIKWSRGSFSTLERESANQYRELLKNIDLEIYRRNFTKFFGSHSMPKSLGELSNLVSEFSESSPENQLVLAKFLIKERQMPSGLAVLARFGIRNKGSLKKYSPYAHFCAKCVFAFYLGLSTGLIGTRPTNRIDLEYIFYLPFCNVFVSGDNFQIDFFKHFLRQDQEVICRDDLKSDLRVIQEFRSEEENKLQRSDPYPPPIENSLTLRLWKKYRGERKTSESRIGKMSKEEEAALLKKVQTFMRAADRNKM